MLATAALLSTAGFSSPGGNGPLGREDPVLGHGQSVLIPELRGSCDDAGMSTQELALPPCPECSSEYTYESGALLTCPMCAHEWAPAEAAPAVDSRDQDEAIGAAVGNPLTDGDTITLEN